MGKASTLGLVGSTFLLFACVSASPADARQIGGSTSNPYPPSAAQSSTHATSPLDQDKNNPDNAVHDRLEEQAAKARNNDRFKRIQSDTAKLLQLSTELKEDVDRSTKNEMSLDVIRKAAEVEKLAHDVKERMKG